MITLKYIDCPLWKHIRVCAPGDAGALDTPPGSPDEATDGARSDSAGAPAAAQGTAAAQPAPPEAIGGAAERGQAPGSRGVRANKIWHEQA